MKKMLIIVGALLVLAAVLLACGGQTGTQAQTTDVPVVEQPTNTAVGNNPTATTAPTDTVVPELDGDPICVVCLYND
jgi:ABC-type glycerol-3-phosphate transport system substrate-binding protein